MKEYIQNYQVVDSICIWQFEKDKNHPGLHIKFKTTSSLLFLIGEMLECPFNSSNTIALNVKCVPDWVSNSFKFHPYNLLILKVEVDASSSSDLSFAGDSLTLTLCKSDLMQLQVLLVGEVFDQSIFLGKDLITFW